MEPDPDLDSPLPAGRTMFLERSSYRKRRTRDAARVLPILGIVLICVPLLWRQELGPEPGQGVSSSSAAIYLFGVWALMIVLAGVLARRLRVTAKDAGDGEIRPTKSPETPSDTPSETGHR